MRLSSWPRTRVELVAADEAARAAQRRAQEVREQSEARERAATAEAERIVLLARTEAKDRVRVIERDIDHQQNRLTELQGQIVVTEDLAMLQEAGIYEYRHRLADAVAYKSRLDHLKDAIKTLVRRDSAILSTTSWTVNGSTTEGRKMVRDFSRLMLRAYNAEADNCVRSMRPHRLPSSIERLDKARDTIAKLGATMHIRIDPGFHSSRVEELELTADYLAEQEEEKERIRAERERQRDEEAARKEFEREKTRLAKEQAHWERVQQKWESQGDEDKVAEAGAKLAEIGEAIAGVERREANIRTGWVYVISNVGAFGEDMVKIGLTRRLDPRERVRELGDASVPFKFDVHALVFSGTPSASRTACTTTSPIGALTGSTCAVSSSAPLPRRCSTSSGAPRPASTSSSTPSSPKPRNGAPASLSPREPPHRALRADITGECGWPAGRVVRVRGFRR